MPTFWIGTSKQQIKFWFWSLDARAEAHFSRSRGWVLYLDTAIKAFTPSRLELLFRPVVNRLVYFTILSPKAKINGISYQFPVLFFFLFVHRSYHSHKETMARGSALSATIFFILPFALLLHIERTLYALKTKITWSSRRRGTRSLPSGVRWAKLFCLPFFLITTRATKRPRTTLSFWKLQFFSWRAWRGSCKQQTCRAWRYWWVLWFLFYVELVFIVIWQKTLWGLSSSKQTLPCWIWPFPRLFNFFVVLYYQSIFHIILLWRNFPFKTLHDRTRKAL